ncbi:hypothetical protein HGRIS_003939 [Hohenbuehelia grisea]|uniref:WLM domain-containing protein n=1 Tax=Hohenbuehelia grisea TaxID=104357 RepID=A0ABR3JGZ2_9AGAR
MQLMVVIQLAHISVFHKLILHSFHSNCLYQHMNHGPDFQKLWSQLRSEVRALQAKGYYGDGYWSSGTRLKDNARVSGDGIDGGNLAQYMCGGALSRKRPTARRRRKSGPRAPVVPSNHTGRQTARKRKAGSRLAENAFDGGGQKLDDSKDAKGTGFGKQAASKRAREERALATERRIQALQSQSQSKASVEPSESSDEFDEEDEIVPETDADRLQTLLQSEKGLDLSDMKALNTDQWFDEPEVSSTLDGKCDLFSAMGSSSKSTFTIGSAKRANLPNVPSKASSDSKGKAKQVFQDSSDDEVEIVSCSFSPEKSPKIDSTRACSGSESRLGLGRMAQTEMEERRKESLGLGRA